LQQQSNNKSRYSDCTCDVAAADVAVAVAAVSGVAVGNRVNVM